MTQPNSTPVLSGATLSRPAKATDREKALASTIDAIRRSLDIASIFQTTTQEARQLLSAERVVIYRFYSDWRGEFVAESVAEGWKPLVSATPVAADTYLQDTQGGRYVHNESSAVNDIYQAGLKDCHIALLEQFQAKAYLITPILQGEKLWGLLAAYQNSTPRQWHQYEVDWLAQIADQLGIALQQAEYLQQMQIQSAQLAKAAEQQRIADLQQAIARTVNKIRQSLDLETIFETATQEIRQLLTCDRVVIYRFQPDWSGKFVAESVADDWTRLMARQHEQPELCENVSECSLKQLAALQLNDTYLQETQGGRFTRGETFRLCNDIYSAGFSQCYLRTLEGFEARAYAIFAIHHEQQLWGLLAAFQNSGPRQWETDEVSLLTQVTTQLGVALQQAEYLQQVQSQAAQIAKAADRQKALAKTVDRIRQSLDIDSIFQTTTNEVRQLLQVERVAIYRFYPDWSGEFVADSIVDGWMPAGRLSPAIAEVLLSKKQAGQFPRHEIFVPILQGEQLWGLLVAYQNSQPRYWEDDEISLLAQVGVQLGIALQQAELLNRTRLQADELSRALQELRHSQSQLIQAEKMASLGQLVAGVAHEINNPVNFIVGNLDHASRYTQDLLTVIRAFQQHRPTLEPDLQAQLNAVDLEFIYTDLPKTIASMQLGADRIRQIVLSLRNFSRLDEADMKPVHIHEGIDSTLLILQHRLKSAVDRASIAVIKEYGDLPLVDCYPAQLNQVFMNILSNAIDALEEEIGNGQTRQPPCIRIRTERSGNRALIRISDNGPGIPEPVRSRIFDPFFTTKSIGKGTGLGLSISYQIVVEKHSGELTCHSQVGYGTEFRIEIPIQ